MSWCFRNEMISRLIDFFLGAASPLSCYTKKKHEIGNRFVATPFGPLLQCLAFLISRARLAGLTNVNYSSFLPVCQDYLNILFVTCINLLLSLKSYRTMTQYAWITKNSTGVQCRRTTIRTVSASSASLCVTRTGPSARASAG